MKFGDPANPLLLLPQRCPHVDARHDGNRLERRPLPGDDSRANREVGKRAVRLRRLPPPDHDVFRRGHGEGRRHRAGRGQGHPRPTRTHHGQDEEVEEVHFRHRPDGRRSEEAVPELQGEGAGGALATSSPTIRRTTLGRGRRGVQELAGPPGRLLSQDRRHPRRVGHRLQRAEHGLRQLGRRSATGVAFSRNPATGGNKFYGEWLVNARAKTSWPASARPAP